MDPIEVSSSSGAETSERSPIGTEIFVLLADFAQLLIMGLLLDLLLFEGIEIPGLVRLVAIVGLLVGVLKSHGWLVLFALQVSLFTREPRRPDMMLGVVPWLYGVTSICLVAYAYLGKPFRNLVSNWLVMQTLLAFGIDKPTVSESSPSRGSSSNSIRFFAIQFAVWIVITLVAMLALLRLPITATARSQWLRNAIENDFTVWPGATLLVLSLLLVIVFMEAGWRQMTSSQASLYLRSTFVLDHYRDLKMIVLRRRKMTRMLVNTGASKKQLVERVADAPPKL